MNEKDIRKIVQEEIQRNSRSGDPVIAPHTHNGTDNLQIKQSDVIPLVVGSGTINMSQSTTYYLKLGNLKQNPSSVSFIGGALHTSATVQHAMIVGVAQLGANQQFQPETTTTVILGPVVENIVQGSAAMISSNTGTTIIKNSQGHIVFAADASNNNYATATITAFDSSKITIVTNLASGWTISGLWVVS